MPSNCVRDEGPLPQGALDALSYVNTKANRVEELEVAIRDFVEIEAAHPLDWNYGPTFDAFNRLKETLG